MLESLLKSVLHNAFVVAVGFAFALLGTGVDKVFGFPRFHSLATLVVGVTLLTAGFLLRVWAAYHFYKHRMNVIVLSAQSHLITTGPYRRLLPDSSRAHEFGSLDPPKITLVSLAAVAERAQSLQGAAPQRRSEVPCRSCRRFADGVLAHVGTPSGSKGAAQPGLRLSRPAPSLHCALKLNPVEPPRYATRMPGGVGGAAP